MEIPKDQSLESLRSRGDDAQADQASAISIYRKFGVTSRAEAIERAVELGLLEDSLYPARTAHGTGA